MRAAFKAVNDHIIAVLVPTTVLAQQHYMPILGSLNLLVEAAVFKSFPE